jgi:hypothetical protein
VSELRTQKVIQWCWVCPPTSGVRPSSESARRRIVGGTVRVGVPTTPIGSWSCETERTDGVHQMRDKNVLPIRHFRSLAWGSTAVRMPRWSCSNRLLRYGLQRWMTALSSAMTFTRAPSSRMMPLKRYSVVEDIVSFSLSSCVWKLLASQWSRRSNGR